MNATQARQIVSETQRETIAEIMSKIEYMASKGYDYYWTKNELTATEIAELQKLGYVVTSSYFGFNSNRITW